MRTITVCLPDDVHQGIEVVAAERHLSVNQLYEEISRIILCGHTTEARFRERVAQGSRQKGLAIIDALDKHYAESRQ